VDGVSDTSDEALLGQQREEIVRALTDCKGRVAGTDGAAARQHKPDNSTFSHEKARYKRQAILSCGKFVTRISGTRRILDRNEWDGM
jgi:hypothetical protein